MPTYRFRVRRQRTGMASGTWEVETYQTTDVQSLVDWLNANIAEPFEYDISSE